MIKVKDGKAVESVLPKTGKLSDGRTVSGYHKLPEDILRAEGWLPEVEKKPEYDPETERLIFSHYEILKTQVNVHYVAEKIPEPEPTKAEVLEKALLDKGVLEEADLTAAKEAEATK